jgi:HSP20 family protein
MGSLQRDINRLFEGMAGREDGFGETRFPLMDVSETDHAVKLRALVPGMQKDDVKISLHENVLSISGEKKVAELPDGARLLRSERAAGRFQRTLRLRKPVDANKIEAHLRDGVLELTLPLEEEAKPRQIDLKVS